MPLTLLYYTKPRIPNEQCASTPGICCSERPGVCVRGPAPGAGHHPQPQPGAAVRVHPTAAAPPQPAGPVERDTEEESSGARHHGPRPWIRR